MVSQFADICLIAAANVVNLALAAMFIARARWPWQARLVCGLLALAMILPVAAGMVLNALAGHAPWLLALPAPLLAHLLLTLLLDHVFKVNFRETRWLGPYLLVYYLGLMGMIGYAFQVNSAAGFVTLATYYLNLGATWYSFSRVGHGAAASLGPRVARRRPVNV